MQIFYKLLSTDYTDLHRLKYLFIRIKNLFEFALKKEKPE
jgi:hypothetical protein